MGTSHVIHPRGWTRGLCSESGLQSLLARALASEARAKQRAKVRESSSHEARSPSSSIASLVLLAPGGLTTAAVTAPSSRESRASTWCYLPALISNTGFSWKKLKFWNRMKSASSQGSLSPLSIFLKKEFLFVAKVAIIPWEDLVKSGYYIAQKDVNL